MQEVSVRSPRGQRRGTPATLLSKTVLGRQRPPRGTHGPGACPRVPWGDHPRCAVPFCACTRGAVTKPCPCPPPAGCPTERLCHVGGNGFRLKPEPLDLKPIHPWTWLDPGAEAGGPHQTQVGTQPFRVRTSNTALTGRQRASS